MKSRNTIWRLGAPLAVGVLSLAAATQAQPNAGEAPLAQNPPNWNNGNRPDWRNMTPAQREAMQAQMRERFIRQGLTQMGFAQADIQDALIEFIAAQDAATRPLQDKSRALLQAMMNKESTEQQIEALANEFRLAADAERTRRTQALADLDTSIGYTKNPRLLALLQVAGIVGDQGSLLNPPGSGLMALMGGRGGQGGRGGGGPNGRGGRGGRGGQNGGQNGAPNNPNGQANGQ